MYNYGRQTIVVPNESGIDMSEPESDIPENITGKILSLSWFLGKLPLAALAGIPLYGFYVLLRIIDSVQLPFEIGPRNIMYETAILAAVWLLILVTPFGRKFINKHKILVCFFACCGLFIIYMFFSFRNGWQEAKKAHVSGNMRSMNMIFHSYSLEDPDGYYPPLAPFPESHIFDASVIYGRHSNSWIMDVLMFAEFPNYEDSQTVITEMINRENIDWERIARVGSQNFLYVAWETTTGDDIKAVLEAQKRISPEEFNKALHVEGYAPFPRLQYNQKKMRLYYRYKSGETTPDEDLSLIDGFEPDKIPVLFGRPYRERERNASFLYVSFLDGRRERLKPDDPQFDVEYIIELMEAESRKP
jgi:hypothetical protein